jgi:hypothetical protein
MTTSRRASARRALGRSGAKRRSKSRGRFRIGRLFYWGAVLGLWAAIAVVGVVVWVGAHLPAIHSLTIPKRPPTIQIVGLDGSVLASRGEMAGANVSLKDLPPYLPKAFIAIEDRRFYSHYGVDPVGIARAAVTNVMHRGVSQGGSTLTQQLAKNLFLTQERTMARKLQEVELAIWLERKHSKSKSSSSISTASISAPALMASRRRRSAISASRPRTSRSRKPRCWRASSNRRRGWRRTAIRKAPSSAPRSCSRRWRMPNSSPTRRRRPRSAIPPTT